MTDEFYNPYYFIPLADKVSDKSIDKNSLKNHSHEKYYDGTKSGRILCKLTTKTPCVFGGKQTREENKAGEIENFKLDGELAIPATSLRGMISSLVEVISGSALRVLEDEKYSVRAEMKDALSAMGLVKKLTEEEKKIDKYNGLEYKLIPLSIPSLSEEDFTANKLGKFSDIFKKNISKFYLQGSSFEEISKIIPNFSYNNTYHIKIDKTAKTKTAKTAKTLVEKLFSLSEAERKEKMSILSRETGIDDFLECRNQRDDIESIIQENPQEISSYYDIAFPSKNELNLETIGKNKISISIGKNKKETKTFIGKTLEKFELSGDTDEKIAVRLRIFKSADRPQGKDGILPNQKKHEFFLHIPDGIEQENNHYVKHLPIPEYVIKNFNAIADYQTQITGKKLKLLPECKISGRDLSKARNQLMPFHPLGRERDDGFKLNIQDNDIVFFNINEHSQVTELSFSSIWRKPVLNGQNIAGTHDFFRKVNSEFLPMNSKRKIITPAELLFGYTTEYGDESSQNKVEAFKGKVKISFGILGQNQNNCEQEKSVLLKILDSPKPPSPNMYFGNEYIAKKDLKISHKPKGVKYYTHHQLPKDSEPWKTTKLTENLSQKSSVTPIKTGTEFYFHLDFDNLSEWEIGLLLYALSPNPEFMHKLGLGKPIGLGSVKIEPIGFFEINRKERYNIDPFNINSPQTRYSKIHSLQGDFSEKMPDFYQAEKLAWDMMNKKEWENKDFEVDSKMEDALQKLGKAYENVSYPITENQATESEGFKWFLANKEKSLQLLEPLPCLKPLKK